jgi:uncharacterized protein (DUF488 family)
VELAGADKLRELIFGADAMATRNLYTFGYEGLSIEDYIARLVEKSIDVVVDVRELPLSRKKGFSKNSFRERLASVGIDYVHEPTLGCPKPIRNQFKLDNDWGSYTRKFVAYLNTQNDTVRALAKLSRAYNACLVCFEANYLECHRTFVARAANKLGAPSTLHILPRTVVVDQEFRVAA